MKFNLVTAALLLAASSALATPPDLNDPTGSQGLMMIDKLGRQIRFFDPGSLKEIAHFEVGTAPHDFAISADHKTAYVPIYGDGIYGRNPNPGHTIAIIDLADKKLAGSIDVSPYQAPHGIQIDASGTIYVTCDLSRKLLVIDPKKGSIEAAIDTEGTGHWVAVLPDASKAYIANKNDKLYVSVIDLKARKIVSRVPMPNGTQGIVASPDGKRVLAMDYGEPAIQVIDTATDKIIDKVMLEGNPKAAFKPRYTPDGSKILVCNQTEGLVNIVTVADLHGKQQVMKVGKDPMGFAISGNGKTALVANQGDGTVSVIDLKEGRVTNTFTAGTGIETLTYF
ncbi:MAG TPA: YncE family protein [Bryobacteraceae bacterium]|jgi:YVTN family beta-propeller protein